MGYFSQIDALARHYAVIATGEVVAVYDACRSYTLYAPVGSSDGQTVEFVGEPRTYFRDELEEIR